MEANDQQRRRSKRRKVIALAVVMLVVALPCLAVGAIGVAVMLEPPERYDLAEPPKDAPYDPVVLGEVSCRLDLMDSAIAGSDTCVVPLLPAGAPAAPPKSYSSVALLFVLSCGSLVDYVDVEAYERKLARNCRLAGNVWDADVKGDEFVAAAKRRFPGFAGRIIEPDDGQEARDAKQVGAAFLAAGLAMLFGGIVALRKAWRWRV